MDLHLMDARATEAERNAVDEVVGPPTSGWEGADRDGQTYRIARGGRDARERRHLLLPALHALQSCAGHISKGGLNYVCQRLSVAPAEAYGVATFYALFTTEPGSPKVLHICDDIACRLEGGAELLEQLRGADGDMKVVASPCLGLCERAPAALVQIAGEQHRETAVAPADRDPLLAAVDRPPAGSPPASTASLGEARLLRRIDRIDPSSLEDYRRAGGYAALRRAIELGPEATIEEVKTSKLLGRGGAAFPTGVKWEAVAQQEARPHYFVANADESEPGTFKDRILMESDPFALIEALTIAGLATGSERGFIYIRGEYPLAHSRLARAIEEATTAGLLGHDVDGSGSRFEIDLRRGAGAYICGEETALFNSIEGKRGEPRNKPPFPVQRGVFGKPTGINNVETLVNVLEVLRIGGAEYSRTGTEGSTGTRLFCVSGTVNSPGLYECPHGVTLREVLELAGGSRGELKAVLLGGAAGSFVGPDDLDIRLSFEDAKAGGYTLGSGVVMAFDRSVDLLDIVLRIARFFRDESCGQCVPCRVGTVRQEEALHRLVSGRTIGSREEEFSLLGEIAQVMRDASICGLGQTAAAAVQSVIGRFGVFEGQAS